MDDEGRLWQFLEEQQLQDCCTLQHIGMNFARSSKKQLKKWLESCKD